MHVDRRQVNTDCDDPAPDADMEDEYGDYVAPISSQHGAESPSTPGVAPGLVPAWSPPTAFPAPAATITRLPPGAPSQHAAFGMPHIPFPLPMGCNGYPQMAASGAPGHGVVSGLQPAGAPAAESALWSWEERELQSKRSRKRKNQGHSEGQKRIKSGGTASNVQQGIAQQGIAQQGIAQQGIAQRGIAQHGVAQQDIPQHGVAQHGMAQQGVAQQGVAQQRVAQQGVAQQGIAQQGVPQQGIAQQGVPQQRVAEHGIAQQGIAQQGIAQPEAFVLRRDARLHAVANAMRESTAVGSDAAAVAPAGDEAKQAAGSAAAAPDAQEKPSANAGTFASSSYGSPSIQATVLSGGIQSRYNFSSF